MFPTPTNTPLTQHFQILAELRWREELCTPNRFRTRDEGPRRHGKHLLHRNRGIVCNVLFSQIPRPLAFMIHQVARVELLSSNQLNVSLRAHTHLQAITRLCIKDIHEEICLQVISLSNNNTQRLHLTHRQRRTPHQETLGETVIVPLVVHQLLRQHRRNPLAVVRGVGWERQLASRVSDDGRTLRLHVDDGWRHRIHISRSGGSR